MRLLDRLVAPGATSGEVVAGFGAAAAGAVLALAIALGARLPPLSVAVVTVIAFDLYGGAVVNATRSAKRHFHRPGRTDRHRLAFVALHLHPFVLAWAVPGVSWGAAATLYGLILAGALAVTAVPGALRRPTAFAATALALTVGTSVVPFPRELAWFAPVLLIKLLLSHLLPEDSVTDAGGPPYDQRRNPEEVS
ncbi:hypothetical protein [Bailinhaonella thermotolerans]|uniref:Uncharacterized protein n=1 Tax=Bailinhaonella thermotolerans TaxID=1070861 RepID=A0A3A4A3Z8_9ACTN|nr:hypothetical protein [Bailinhaonella thermotolerans]RJL19503.1 hypothetical protein D5H75_40320 [Bailinhaonella thermotolerans]